MVVVAAVAAVAAVVLVEPVPDVVFRVGYSVSHQLHSRPATVEGYDVVWAAVAVSWVTPMHRLMMMMI